MSKPEFDFLENRYGGKEVCGMYFSENERANFCLGVLTEPRVLLGKNEARFELKFQERFGLGQTSPGMNSDTVFTEPKFEYLITVHKLAYNY
ncbi:hypothetical protein [Solitalea koreensis]|uniref:Uncharacterized protein n=1 Tax=Solitalea koreensis TaxID=543615 RepID=A0A521BGM1_9SPHI|nr:hypothetical protein [Solitalea koreensis]SMO46091.1 hypothetical protein SAMN06265350_102173 [Solitalea koreensis]